MLRRIVLICALLSVFTQPAIADDRTYLIYQQGEQRSSDMWVGPEPTADQIGEFAHALPWLPIADEKGQIDRNPLNYVNANGNVRRAPPVVEVVELPPQPDIPKFFDGLVKTIISGQIPGDVHAKALMVKDLKSPSDQAAALAAFSSDPSYSKEQKALLDALIKDANLALPDVPGK